jgi:N-acetylneuraminate synthase
MSNWDEIDAAVTLVRERSQAPLAVLQCTSEYPTAPEDIGLNVVAQIEERYGCAAGLSDHSGTIFPALGAIALGARVVEVHIALSRDMFGPDVVASVTPPELAELVRGARILAEALAAPVDKDAMARRLEPTRELFTKSIVALRDLDAGTVLTASDLAVKKPGGGMEPSRLTQVVGRRVRAAVAADQALRDDDLELPEPDDAAV